MLVTSIFSPPTMLSSYPKMINFSITFILLSAKAFSFDQSKILSFGKELIMCKKIYILVHLYSYLRNYVLYQSRVNCDC